MLSPEILPDHRVTFRIAAAPDLSSWHLRDAGHDVVAIAEVAKGATDEQVLERAVNEKRVLITKDRDFGELLYARGRSSAGVILTRSHSRVRQAKPATVVEAVTKLGARLRNAFYRCGARTSALKRSAVNSAKSGCTLGCNATSRRLLLAPKLAIGAMKLRLVLFQLI